jgi:hypothetical protein
MWQLVGGIDEPGIGNMQHVRFEDAVVPACHFLAGEIGFDRP